MRFLVPSAFVLVCALGASAQSYSNEPNTYRHGGTYSTTQAHSEQSCAETCRADTKCLAWSFLKPDTGIGSSTCELKQTLGTAEENPLMTSGVSPRFASQHQAAPRPESTDDLLGGEFEVQHSAAPDPVEHTQVVSHDFSPAPLQSTTTFTAAPSRPSGRVLSANDPAIVRQGISGNAVPAPVAAPSATALPPPPRVPVQQAAPQQPVAQERPYDNLRNREFPRYSVQDDTAFEGDTIVEDIFVDNGGGGAGS